MVSLYTVWSCDYSWCLTLGPHRLPLPDDCLAELLWLARVWCPHRQHCCCCAATTNPIFLTWVSLWQIQYSKSLVNKWKNSVHRKARCETDRGVELKHFKYFFHVYDRFYRYTHLNWYFWWELRDSFEKNWWDDRSLDDAPWARLLTCGCNFPLNLFDTHKPG